MEKKQKYTKKKKKKEKKNKYRHNPWYARMVNAIQLIIKTDLTFMTSFSFAAPQLLLFNSIPFHNISYELYFRLALTYTCMLYMLYYLYVCRLVFVTFVYTV